MTKYPVKVDRKMEVVASIVFFVSTFGGIGISLVGILLHIPAVGWFGTGICSVPFLLLGLRMLGVAKTLCCAMGWHCPNGKMLDVHHKTNDPLHFLLYAKCSWCGYEGQLDSQGNLF